jgi:hypothetical protein
MQPNTITDVGGKNPNVNFSKIRIMDVQLVINGIHVDNVKANGVKDVTHVLTFIRKIISIFTLTIEITVVVLKVRKIYVINAENVVVNANAMDMVDMVDMVVMDQTAVAINAKPTITNMVTNVAMMT